MNKIYAIISIFLISNLSFSQNLNFVDTWILEFISIDKVSYPNTSEYPITDDNGNRILLNLQALSTANFHTTVCNSMEVQYSEDTDDNNFTVLSTNTTLEACNNLGDQDFENLYFSFFQPSTTYTYEIGCLLSGSACFLTIYSPNGDNAHFWNGELSNDSNDQLAFSIYPIPVKNILNLSINYSSLFKIEIFDARGKVLIKKDKFNTKFINIEHLATGIYFLSLTDDLGRNSIKKFVK